MTSEAELNAEGIASTSDAVTFLIRVKNARQLQSWQVINKVQEKLYYVGLFPEPLILRRLTGTGMRQVRPGS